MRRAAPGAAGALAVAGVVAALVGSGGPAPLLPNDGGLRLRGGSTAPAAATRAALGWCGGTEGVAGDRPDSVGGRQVHVIYAFPADGVDRFAALAGPIASDVGSMDAWWRRQDPTRTPRFDLFAFPGCSAGFDRLDISRVQLQQPAAYYADPSTRLGRIVLEVDQTFFDPAKKYLVYYDGAVDEPRLCGQSTMDPQEGGRYAFSVIYAQACQADIGTGVVTADVALHELTHNLGAVPPEGPPNACPGDEAHVCDDENDLMYPYTRGQGLNALTLDVGHDDYYEHGQTWWDVRNSAWLAHLDAPQYVLGASLGKSTGTGTITSDLPGIACPPACSVAWDQGSSVTLTAHPDDRSRFVGWSGACTADPCSLTMSSSRSVVALFAAQVDLSVVVRHAAGISGTVRSTPAGIACPPICTGTFDKGSTVRLAESPGGRSVFAGWTGACRGKAGCLVVAGSAPTVTARFAGRR